MSLFWQWRGLLGWQWWQYGWGYILKKVLRNTPGLISFLIWDIETNCPCYLVLWTKQTNKKKTPWTLMTMPIILATLEAKMGRIMVQGQLRQIGWENPNSPN
jgi:hypothetical protein